MIATVRAIFDSRYNDFVYHSSNVEKIMDFSEYAHWWLGEYMVDKSSKRVVRLESYQDEDHERLL